MRKTYMAKPRVGAAKWHVLDADGQILGRLASHAAVLLRGKHKPEFTPHVDTGDGVIVINAAKVRVTGLKLEQKMYSRYSGYPGGLTKEPLAHLLERDPAAVIKHAVVGMLPKNRLGRQIAKKLKVYPGTEHPHAAQQPAPLAMESL